MRSARHQLILLGLVCQGLSWDDWVLPLLYAAAWMVSLRWGSGRLRSGPTAELMLLVGGCAAAFLLGLSLGRSTHFFIGHGLALVQLARLLRPLTRRERLISLLIAIFHVGVACTFVFDLRFIPILIAAIILVPRALAELAGEPCAAVASATQPALLHRSPRPAGGRLALPLPWYGVIALLMTLFYLLFPRVFLGMPLAAPRRGGPGQGTMLDAMLDPAGSGAAQSGRVVFHIQGENLGYLRCFSLSEFDGSKWTAARRSPMRQLVGAPAERLVTCLHRRVRVKNALFLGRVLPVDGRVVTLRGRFFGRVYQNAHGPVETDFMWNTANNVYEYWIQTNAPPERLYRQQIEASTRHPEPSAAVAAWLDQRLAGINDPYLQARQLEAHLRDNFRYVLGAPALSRAKPVEDFLLREKEGHCERFASALAYVLRAKGIPSRVVIGYVPVSRNVLTGGYNVRFKDAHAWTEAWFAEQGWVRLDATPRATMVSESWSFPDFLADLDMAWSSYVVNFDTPAQGQLLSSSFQALGQLAGWVSRHWLVPWGLAAVALLYLAGRRLWTGRRARSLPVVLRRQAELAETSYSQMLRWLAKWGFHREAHQTPFEFALRLERQPGLPWAEVWTVTRLYCLTRYGERILSEAQLAEVRSALHQIRAAAGRR